MPGRPIPGAARAGALLLATAAGCGGADAASGLTAWLRASDGQYAPGALETAVAVPGPSVDNIRSKNTHVFPGARGRALSGSMGGTATGVRIGLAGDSGHWILPAGVEDLEAPGNVTFQTTLSFSPDLPIGDQSLIFRAVDGAGQVGPAQVLPLKVEPATPAGALVIALFWDSEADLDLHVQVPNVADPNASYEVWAKATLALPPRGSSEPPPTADEVRAAGQLDFDSNAQCVIDGRRQEDLVFPQPPPAGSYQVRVDAFSLCGQATARWHALALDADGNALAEAFGQVTDPQTRGSHGAGAGILAFTFSIP